MVVNFSCSRLFVRRKNREYFETYFLEDGVNILITKTIYDGCKHNRLCFAINRERLFGDNGGNNDDWANVFCIKVAIMWR